jgi:hypothetical protein
MKLLRSLLVVLWVAAPAFAGVTAWVPLQIRDGMVLFPVEVSGVAGEAMFDTGAAGHGVSKALVAQAGLSLSGRQWIIEGAGSTDERVPSVSRLPIKLFGVPFVLQDVPAFSLDVQLIIGAGFLRSGVLQLDYPNKRMRLIEHGSVDLSKVANVPLRLEEATGLPAIQVRIDGKQRWMLLDTGNAGPIVMPRMIAEEEDWIGRFKRAESGFVDINAGVSNTDVLVLPAVEIGPYELEDVPVAVPAEGEGSNLLRRRSAGQIANQSRIHTGVRSSGVLGYEVLRHFVVTLDYKREKLHLGLPAEEPAAPAHEPLSAGVEGTPSE